jgi:hypothetical protein
MKIRPLAAALVAIGTIGAASSAVAGDLEARIAELERQLEELKSQVSGNQQNITTNQQSLVTAQTDIEEARPSKKGTKFQYGGFIQLDAIATDYSEGKPSNDLIEDFLVPSLIPVESGGRSADSYNSTGLHAKTSRFYFTTSTPTDAGTISTRVELDFMLSDQGDERISNSWSSRIRHAFVNWEYAPGSSLLAGQSWTTFFNVGALPDVLDFVGPVGTLFVRQPQIRWTMGGLQLAVENPATRLNHLDASGALSTSYDDFNEGIPDLVARYNGNMGGLGWSVAALARELAYEARPTADVEGDNDNQFVYGLSLAGVWTLGSDDLRFMVNYGDGLGRYMGLNAFNDGYIDASGDIGTIDQWGAFLAYRHYWTPKWRSTFSVSAIGADNPGINDFIHAGALAENYQSFHANLNYLPAPGLQIGGEYLYAMKELENGSDGDLNRLQFAVKYAF